jgi:hypothetical protein
MITEKLKAVFTNLDTGKELILNIEYDKNISNFDIKIESNPKESIREMLENNESHVLMASMLINVLNNKP